MGKEFLKIEAYRTQSVIDIQHRAERLGQAYGLLHDEILPIPPSGVAAPHAYGVEPYYRLGQPSDEKSGFEAAIGKSTPELGSVEGLRYILER